MLDEFKNAGFTAKADHVLSPLQMEILLHYYWCPFDFRDGDFGAPAVRGAISRFLHEKLIAPSEGKGDSAYIITDRGRCHVEALGRVPLPVQVWQTP